MPKTYVAVLVQFSPNHHQNNMNSIETLHKNIISKINLSDEEFELIADNFRAIQMNK